MESPELPHFVCLDSSHWAGLADDLRSASTSGSALRRIAELQSLDGVLVLTWHHILELIQHGNEVVATERVEALQSLPVLATVSPEPDSILGTVVNVLAREADVALCFPQATASDVAHQVKPTLFTRVNGAHVCEAVMAHFQQFREYALSQQPKHRELAVLGQSQVLDQSRQPFLLNGKARALPEVIKHFETLRSDLLEEASRRKDPRMLKADEPVNRFVDDLIQMAASIGNSSSPIDGILSAAGLTREDVEHCRTLEDVMNIGFFRHQLKVASRQLELPCDVIKSIRPDAIPTFVIQRALIRHRQVASSVSGGDIHDSHLLSLAPYIDTLFVDKRTHENVRRILAKDTDAKPFLASVLKAKSWQTALDATLPRLPKN